MPRPLASNLDVADLLVSAAGQFDRFGVFRWRADQHENPYLGYLAGADALVVTGESESMIAEACGTGTPVYIFPLPKRAPDLGQRIVNAVTARAFSRPQKSKGTFRPQQGTEYFCSRLIERGIVHPTRDLEAFHRLLVEGGHAKMFDGILDSSAPAPLDETPIVAARVRALLGCPTNDALPQQPHSLEPGVGARPS